MQGRNEELTKWHDFHARQYDAALGRWFGVDPQDQFASPYLAMGNNPVMYVDPDGEFVIPMLIGAAISVLTNGINNVSNNQSFFQGAGKAALIGGIGGALSFGIGEIAQGLSGFAKFGFQTAAHGTLGGGMSALSGGNFGQGFLSGSFASMISTGSGGLLKKSSNFTRGLGTIGSGSLAGGLGSSIAGGSFWGGARNGAISSGLNHAVHSGFFGEGIAMSALTGKTRHLWGPDARSFNITAEGSFGGTMGVEAGLMQILRGSDAGYYLMQDQGAGMLTDIQVSAGVENSRYYYSGSKNTLKRTTFEGLRTEGNFNVTVLPSVSFGVTGSYAVVDGGANRVYSIGSTATIGLSAFEFLPVTFGINRGVTKLRPANKMRWR